VIEGRGCGVDGVGCEVSAKVEGLWEWKLVGVLE
jgi:hypothetical protein